MKRRRTIVLWSAAGGAAAAVCWLPFGLAPLYPLAFVIAMHGLDLVESGRDAVAFGVANGIARYGVAAHFLLALTRYSVPIGIAFYLMAIAYIVPFAILEAWGAYTLERRAGLPRYLGLGLIWALMEHVRTLGDLSFPADLVPHAFGTHPAFLAWNDVIGPVGFTLLCYAVAVLLFLALRALPDRRAAASLAIAAVALWLAPPLTDRLSSPPDDSAATHLRVGIVQPTIEVRDKMSRQRWPALWARMSTLTVAAARDADLVVWPETARPGPLVWNEGEPLEDPEMTALAERIGVPLLYGCEIARVDHGRVTAIYNGAVMVRPGQTRPVWYGKQRLLPFAEGVPFADLVGWDPASRAHDPGHRSLLSLLGNFRPGPGPAIFEVGPARIGVLICYESMYPSLARAYAREGANTLAVLTNDAWWGRSVFAWWHARMVAARAREIDVPVIRGANSGVTSATDSRGVLRAATDLFEVTTLNVDIEPSAAGPTYYAMAGDAAPALVLLVLLAALGRATLRQLSMRKRKSPAWVVSPLGAKVLSTNVTSPRWSISSTVEQRVP